MRPIDADALKSVICRKCANGEIIDDECDGESCSMLREIENAPTIEAEPVRHAHWEFRDSDKKLLDEGMIPANMWCSYCGSHHDNDDYEDMYCKNCGARMDGGADNG